MAEKVVLVLYKSKEYRHSIRFDAPAEPVLEGALTNLYIKRPYLEQMGNPEKIRMTLETEPSTG